MDVASWVARRANGVMEGRTANALPGSLAELTAWACRGRRCLQRHPEIVADVFRHGGLHVTQQPE